MHPFLKQKKKDNTTTIVQKNEQKGQVLDVGKLI